jgi:L-fuconolactonase
VQRKIDSHQHFWRYDPSAYGWIDDSMAVLRRDFLPADLEPEMASAGVGACIAVQARQSLEETEWLLALAEANAFITGVVGWVDLQAEDVREQLGSFLPSRKLVGVRHVVQAEADHRFLVRPAFCRGIAMLEEADLAYDLLIYPRHLGVAAELVSRFSRQRFVLDHAAKPDIRGGEIDDWERGIRTLAAFPHVFCKVSGLITEADWGCWTEGDLRPYLDVVFDAFGASRLMAGSDWPVCTVAGDYARTLGVLKHYLSHKPERDGDAVMGGNAMRFYKTGELG